jgi:hypothetical protein
MKREYWFLVIGVLIGLAAGALVATQVNRPALVAEAERTRTPAVQPTATRVRITPTLALPPTGEPPYPVNTPTPGPTKTPGPTNTPPPASEDNWIANGTFEGDSFTGWKEIKGYWSEALHGPVPCGDYRGWWLQMDTVDPAHLNGWPPPPAEDTAWTDFTAPITPTVLHLSWEEIHHITQGTIRIRVLGYNGDFDTEWDVLYEKLGASSPSGKCTTAPPKKVSVDIPLSADYSLFRLEVYGKINTAQDAILLGNFTITGDRNGT